MGSLFGGGQKQTQTYKPPSWVEAGAKSALKIGERLANQRYSAYQGQRFAPLSQNERQAVELARTAPGAYQQDLESARGALNRASQSFVDADINAYMNPFIKGALDPTAREIREEGARRQAALTGSLASTGAFSGSRGILAQSELDRTTDQSLSDLYGRGYAEAFDRAQNAWQADRDASMRSAEGFLRTAGFEQDAIAQAVRNLVGTGEQERGVIQSMRDFDYQQFVEGRDWDARSLNALTSALNGIKGSYTTQQTSETKNDPMTQVLGLAATVAGAYFTGGASLAAGAASGALSKSDAGASGAPMGYYT